MNNRQDAKSATCSKEGLTAKSAENSKKGKVSKSAPKGRYIPAQGNALGSDMNNMPVPVDTIRQAIILLRGQKVILDRDLAALYGVPTKALKQAVKRNADRFPDDFMFVMDPEEFAEWRSQFVTSKADRMGLRYPPMAFTEQGVAMLSSVLNSERAVKVNIAIMRAFVQLRCLLETHEDLARKLTELEKKYDAQFRAVFDAIRQLMAPPDPPPKKIGFGVRERRAKYSVKKRRSTQ